MNKTSVAHKRIGKMSYQLKGKFWMIAPILRKEIWHIKFKFSIQRINI